MQPCHAIQGRSIPSSAVLGRGRLGGGGGSIMQDTQFYFISVQPTAGANLA